MILQNNKLLVKLESEGLLFGSFPQGVTRFF